MSYLFNCACLATFLAVFNLRETLLHDSSVVVTFCMHDTDKAVVLVSSSDKLSSEIHIVSPSSDILLFDS